MKKALLLTLSAAMIPAWAQDAPTPPAQPAPPANGEQAQPPHQGPQGPRGNEANRGPRRDQISPEIMGMLVLGRGLVMEKFDADKDGRLSEQEREAIKPYLEGKQAEFLKRYDKDQDGKLSPEEWAAMRDAWSKANPGFEEKLKEFIKAILPRPGEQNEGPRNMQRDPNRPGDDKGNGNGERNQPKAENDSPRQGEGRDRAPRPTFSPLGILGAKGPNDPIIIATACVILEKYDQDKDGVLSEAEFKQYQDDAKTAMDKRRDEMKKRRDEMLKKYDKDGDGKLSQEEREAMREDIKNLRQKNNQQ